MIKSNLSFLLVFLPTLSFGVKTINNTEKYKPCIAGDKCCGDYCCNTAYYDALKKQDCLDDVICTSIINKILESDAESQICQTDANCTTQQLGEKCCTDDPILKDIILSDEALNWKGQKRCCMHNEGKRTLDDLDLDALIMVDESAISAKIYEMPNKKAYCEGLQKNTQEAFQTCKNLQGAKMGEEFIPQTLPQEKTSTQEKQITKSDPSKSASAGIRFSFFTLIGILIFHF